MSARAAVVVGVNKTGGLTPLRAAVSGAHQVENWLKAEGFEVTRLDDDNAPVKIGQIKDAVKAYLDRSTFEQIVIYFAGHGYLNGSSEIWLLSGAPDDPDDAVNLTESVERARSCGVRSVAFISDACRSVPPSITGSRVGGSSIFPNRTNNRIDAEIDCFFATKPGDPALELPMDEDRVSYVGLFTEMLRRLHQNPDQSLIRTIRNGDVDTIVVPCRRLKDILPERVNEAAQERSIRLRQKPQLRLECDENTFIARAEYEVSGKIEPSQDIDVGIPLFGKFFSSPDTLEYGSGIGDKGPVEGTVTGIPFNLDVPTPRSPFLYLLPPMHTPPVPSPAYQAFAYSPEIQSAIAFDPGFAAAINRVAKADSHAGDHPWLGGDRSEAGAGVQVTGATVMWVEAVGMKAKRLGNDPSGASLVQLYGESGQPAPTRPGSVLLQFGDGSGTVLAGLPGYTASVTVESGRVINVSYVPSLGSWLRGEYVGRREPIAILRAVAAAAARNGFLASDREEARGFADLIRMSKSLDPTLGLYAALAYAELGLQKDAHSVLRYMRYDLHANLFDVALLAAQMPAYPDPGVGAPPRLRPRASIPPDSPPTVPFCPMLSQSWSYLRPRGVGLPSALGKAGRHRRAALWTTFDPDGMALLHGAFKHSSRKRILP